MAQILATYIALPGTTAEAFEHWHEVLGGELKMQKYGDTPMPGMPFEPDPNAVAHVTLDLPGGHLAGGDAMDDETYNIEGSAYSLLYQVDTVEDAQAIIDKFVAAGGRVGMPFEQAPWGDHYGQVFDKFGVMWALNVPAAQ
ncbi:VOC family protein [Gulosibacter molinativorax]|uniref:VOC family protein n=1 Tax=Gulosibacter molinativorax TaxID=256821 RepID=A0ABT7CAK1_9MICO|nr:VOC family protein [Gulosibacter molinativorax]MDJ1372182.1 VOC family protein [Gulosibacter molinativorax]QUY60947.1 Hypotetical protein [Gulosibacter molinativorax]